jgi:dTDP-4-dehydrorhamnose reductase
LHISTNAVFSANENRPWGIKDHLSPLSHYEKSKAVGEDPRSYVVRASFVGTCWRNRGIFDKLLIGSSYLDQKWNGVTVWTLAKRIVEIINNYYENPKGAVEHVHSPNVITFKELAAHIKSSSICDDYVKDARPLQEGVILPDIYTQIEEYINLVHSQYPGNI